MARKSTAAKAAATTRAKAQRPRSGGAAKSGERKRQNLIVDTAVLRRAMKALGTTNMSRTVNVALERLAEDEAILDGLQAAIGAIPDFPDVET